MLDRRSLRHTLALASTLSLAAVLVVGRVHR